MNSFKIGNIDFEDLDGNSLVEVTLELFGKWVSQCDWLFSLYHLMVNTSLVRCISNSGRMKAEFTMVWFALGKSFHLCRLKNHKNLKPQSERKTFRQKRRVALVGENCQ